MIVGKESAVQLGELILDLLRDQSPPVIGTPTRLQALAYAAARIAGDNLEQSDAEQRSAHAKALGAMFASTAESIWTSEAEVSPPPGAAHH